LARKRTIPKDPQKLSQFWESLSDEHFQSYQQVRRWCDRRMEYYLRTEQEEEDPDYLPSAQEVRSVAQCLHVAVTGEREAAAAQYRDRTIAIEEVKRIGFLVERPDGYEVNPDYVSQP
jgi:hypothetical protein